MSLKSSIFDNSQPRSRSGCDVCGAERGMVVRLVAQEIPERTAWDTESYAPRRSVSVNRYLCTYHGEKIYLELAPSLEDIAFTERNEMSAVS